jgi:hypothetical protein
MNIGNKISTVLAICVIAFAALSFAKNDLDVPYLQNGIEGSWLKSAGHGPESFTIRAHGDNIKVRFDDTTYIYVPSDGSERAENERTAAWYSANVGKHQLIIRKRAVVKPMPLAGQPLSQSVSELSFTSSDGRSLTYRTGTHTATYVRPSLRYRLFRALP